MNDRQPIPLDKRLERLKAGLPGNPNHAAPAAARALACSTLDSFLWELSPRWREELLEDLELDGQAQVRAAAVQIRALMQAESGSAARMQGEDLLWRLCGPLELSYRKGAKCA